MLCLIASPLATIKSTIASLFAKAFSLPLIVVLKYLFKSLALKVLVIFDPFNGLPYNVEPSPPK